MQVGAFARASCASAALLSGAAAPASAHSPYVDRLEMVATQGADGWRLAVTVVGLDISVVRLTHPPAPFIAPVCEPEGAVIVCRSLDPTPPAPGQASLAALLDVHPAGDYGVAVDGELSATVAFDPLEPDGLVTVIAPPDGASGIGGTPSIDYTSACDNCTTLRLTLTDGVAIELAHEIAGAPPAALGSIPYGDFETVAGSAPASLPDGPYAVRASAVLGASSAVDWAEGGGFAFASGAERATHGTFSVPEPTAPVAAAAAVLALAVLAVGRSRCGRA